MKRLLLILLLCGCADWATLPTAPDESEIEYPQPEEGEAESHD